MSTLQEIRSAIDALSLEERAELIAELCGWIDDDWDLQMKRDSAASKFVEMNRDADQAMESGTAETLEKILSRS